MSTTENNELQLLETIIEILNVLTMQNVNIENILHNMQNGKISDLKTDTLSSTQDNFCEIKNRFENISKSVQEKKIKELEEKINLFENVIEIKDMKIEKIKNKKNKLKNIIRDINYDAGIIKKFESKIKELENENNNMLLIINNKNDALNLAKNAIEEYDENIIEKDNLINRLNGELNEKNSFMNRLNCELNEKNSFIEKLNIENEKYKKRITNLETLIKTILKRR